VRRADPLAWAKSPSAFVPIIRGGLNAHLSRVTNGVPRRALFEVPIRKEDSMLRLSTTRAAAFIAAALTLAASSAFAANLDNTRTSRGFNSFVPGASQQWCDSLAYPYCSTPAPGTEGSGPAPYVHPAPARPVFGQ
jgi:hypothetical protein